MCIYRRSERLVLACRMVAVCWMLLALFFVSMFAGFAGWGPAEATGRTMLGSLMLACMILPVELCIACTLRCPACRGWVLLQTWGPFHSSARSVEPGGYYAVVVLDVLRRRRFTCMYCGHECTVGYPDGHPTVGREMP